MASTRKPTTKKSTKKSATSKKSNKKASKGLSQNGVCILCGILCFLIALCIFVSYFNGEAIAIQGIANLLKGLFGFGYWMFGVSFLWVGFILIDNRGEKLTSYLVCNFLFAFLFGSIFHLFSVHEEFVLGLEGIKPLWYAGISLECGGVISGGIAVLFLKLLGKVVSAVILIVCALVTLAIGLRLTPEKIKEAVEEARAYKEEKNQLREEEREEDLFSKNSELIRERKRVQTSHTNNRARSIDIPLDDDKVPVEEAAYLKSEKKTLLKQKPAHVLTPAEALNPNVTSQVVTDVESEVIEQEIKPSEDPIETMSSHKKTKEDTAAIEKAAMEVKNEIDKELAQKEPEYQFPPITLLKQGKTGNSSEAGAELRNNSQRLAATLVSFGVDAVAGEVVHGPSVTRYEFILEQGVKLSKITNLSDDIALALGASGVRIAPVPGKIGAVGIEVPNTNVTAVPIRDVLETKEFTGSTSNTAFAVGKDIGGHAIVGNIGKLPHVLIAGTTGSGKSVCTNSLIISLLYKSSPDAVRFIMVDPKMVELAPYAGIPHLLIPVVTDPKKAAGALQWSVYEMMKRYKMFSELGVKDLAGFNALNQKDPNIQKLPSIVIVIDELADLMLVAAKEVEESICRVAQMGRAAGVHLVIATQRPSADVITGLMKANIPSRIAFAVASAMESRIILDTSGAEKLVGRGDMLYFPLGDSKPTRVQGCFISPEEIEKVVSFVKQSGEAQYDQSVMDKIDEVVDKGDKSNSANNAVEKKEKDDADELLPAAIDVILDIGQASVSMLQRKLKLGYSRAARLVDQMEERGIVGPFEGSKPRQILITKAQWQEMQMKNSLEAESSEPVEKPSPYGSIQDVFESHDALE